MTKMKILFCAVFSGLFLLSIAGDTLAQTIAIEKTQPGDPGCITDHAYRLTGGPFQAVTWSVSPSSKATVSPGTPSPHICGFWWVPANCAENDQVVLRADYVRNGVPSFKTLTITYKEPTASITPAGPISIYFNQNTTLTTPFKSTYAYQWYYYYVGFGWDELAGATSNTHTTNRTGKFYVSVSNGGVCGDNTSNTVEILGIMLPPTIQRTTICEGESVRAGCDLTNPLGTSSIKSESARSAVVMPMVAPQCEVSWYYNINDTAPFHTGPFPAPYTSTPTTYYVETRYLSHSSGRVPVTITVLQAPVKPTFVISQPNLLPKEVTIVNITNPSANQLYTFNWGDGKKTKNFSGSASHAYLDPGAYTLVVEAKNMLTGCISQDSKPINVINALCMSSFPSTNGTFKVDKVTGNIVFMRNDCPVQSLMTCANGPSTIKQRVVKSDAVTFRDTWPSENYPHMDAAVQQNPNQFQKGERGKWRVQNSYVHSTSLIAENKNFKEGTYYLQNFNWANPSSSDRRKWVLNASVTAYSPNGDALSEVNALNIESAVKFGYNESVPYMTVQNASFNSVLFESFESTYTGNTVLEDNLNVSPGSIDNTTIAHSGMQSLRLTNGGDYPTREFLANNQILTKGLLIKTWVRLPSTSAYSSLSSSFKVKLCDENLNQIVAPINFTTVARTGEWILCEAFLNNFGGLAEGASFIPVLQYTNGIVWLDDLRIQPSDSEVKCYVYNPKDLKLLTVFDDQHFGLYYQYNAEGKLIRKMIESERGIKTVQETHYNTKLIPN